MVVVVIRLWLYFHSFILRKYNIPVPLVMYDQRPTHEIAARMVPASPLFLRLGKGGGRGVTIYL